MTLNRGNRIAADPQETMRSEKEGGRVAQRRSPRRFAVLSIAAAVVTILLKTLAYRLTGSVGLLSDAIESLVNLAAALVALWALTVAARPPSDKHTHGLSKAEYLSSGLEGALILAAAAAIAVAAIGRLSHPRALTEVWSGLAISMLAAAINGAVALVLLRAGRQHRSITLRADAHHLLTDVWTSAGVVAGVLLVKVTGLLVLDPLIALLVAANIVRAGWRLLRETADGLLDSALPSSDRSILADVLSRYQREGIVFHALRTRIAGARRFVSMHVLVPRSWSVQRGHDLCERIERDVIEALPGSSVFTHLEPLEDPVSWDDRMLDRGGPVRGKL
jgi:cation diffusion facilitator family transporter